MQYSIDKIKDILSSKIALMNEINKHIENENENEQKINDENFSKTSQLLDEISSQFLIPANVVVRKKCIFFGKPKIVQIRNIERFSFNESHEYGKTTISFDINGNKNTKYHYDRNYCTHNIKGVNVTFTCYYDRIRKNYSYYHSTISKCERLLNKLDLTDLTHITLSREEEELIEYIRSITEC